jgi:starch synthase
VNDNDRETGERKRSMSIGAKVLFVASEAKPYARTGGLAEVVGSLSKALHRLGCDVRVIIPYYSEVRKGPFPITACLEDLKVDFHDGSLTADVMCTQNDEGLFVYFIQRDELYDRSYLYATPKGDYLDNAYRFIYFSKSIFPLCKSLGFQPDILHCHDWQTALVPAYLKHIYRSDPFFQHTASILTLHNIAYQGVFPSSSFRWTGFPSFMNTMQEMEYWGKINFLKAGINSADVINTVSPTYSHEILQEAYGYGLQGVLSARGKDLYGILNGVDYDEWDPSRDPYLEQRYTADTLDGKAACKRSLLEELGLQLDPEKVPCIGMVSRLTGQKGIDILSTAMKTVLARDLAFVLLGLGEKQYQDLMMRLSECYPGKMGLRIGYDNGLAHRIMAGCDMFLMPSRYEPCGLSQFYSMKYGTIPIVRATGGLEDSVHEFDPVAMQGTGFKFRSYSSGALVDAIRRALEVYRNQTTWKLLRENCMQQNFSWEQSARKYLELYDSARKRISQLRVRFIRSKTAQSQGHSE